MESKEKEYTITRTTIPTFLKSIFILPYNVGYISSITGIRAFRSIACPTCTGS